MRRFFTRGTAVSLVLAAMLLPAPAVFAEDSAACAPPNPDAQGATAELAQQPFPLGLLASGIAQMGLVDELTIFGTEEFQGLELCPPGKLP